MEELPEFAVDVYNLSARLVYIYQDTPGFWRCIEALEEEAYLDPDIQDWMSGVIEGQGGAINVSALYPVSDLPAEVLKYIRREIHERIY
jgi:hypothetical protein